MRAAGSDVSGEPVANLRGAAVAVDARRVGAVAAGLAVLALALAAAALYVAGAHRNAQVAALRRNGVEVVASLTHCFGLMGGSGSNLVGYQCRATYTVGGRSYRADVTGTSAVPPGSMMRLVADRANPYLVATPAATARQRPSWRVFVLPTVLLLLSLVAGGLWRRWTGDRAAAGRRGPTARSRRAGTGFRSPSSAS